MIIQVERKYTAPPYPDKDAARCNPALLKSTPERWKYNASAYAALATTVLLLASACEVENPTLPTVTASSQSTANAPWICTGTPQPTPATAARVKLPVPLFEHGSGRGGFGCVSVNPPVFLSEDEALDVIRTTAEQEGLNLTQAISVKTKIPSIRFDPNKRNRETIVAQAGELALDGYDGNGIAFEYISTSDVDSWKDQPSGTFTSYPFLDTAKVMAEGFADTGMTVAVFYDPAATFGDLATKDRSMTAGQIKNDVKEHAKADLRQQVLDFIAWLKAEGVI